MDLPEQIESFRQFFELNEEYRNILYEQVREGKNFISIDFNELARHSPEMAELLLEDPEEILKAGQVAIEKMDLPQPSEDRSRFEIRMVNLPPNHRLKLREVRSKHLNKFVEVEGIVKQKSDVRPQVTSARFECPSCGNIIPTIQMDEKFKEPARCGCGRKGKFKLLSKEFMDAQSLTLEESPEDLDGGEQPKRLKIFLTKDLVSPMSDRYTNPGSRIKLVGTIKEVPIVLQSGGQSTRFDLILDANSIFTVQEDFSEIEIDDEEKKEILELSQDPDLFEKLVASLVPTIYGHEPIKQALLLQMFGGRHKTPGRGAKNRGDIHVLLIGDPGAGKCCSGDTLVQLGDGSIKRIETVVNTGLGESLGDGAFSTNSIMSASTLAKTGQVRNSRVRTLWKRKTNSILKITLQSGKTIKVTRDHPFFTPKDCFILPIDAKFLQVGSYIACPRKISVNTELQKTTNWTKSRSNNAIRIDPVKVVDKNLARVLGYLTGDGWVQSKPTTQLAHKVTFVNQDLEVVNDYVRCIEKSLGVTPKIVPCGRNKKAYECLMGSCEVNSFITSLAPEIVEKHVPDCIAKSPNNVAKEYIKALFECDGYNDKNRRTVGFCSKFKLLVDELQFLLLRFGVQSQIRPKLKYATNTKDKTKKTYYDLIISGKDTDFFLDRIGFVSTRKNSIRHAKKYNTNTDVLPSIERFLKILRIRNKKKISDMPIPYGSYRHYEKGDRLPSREQVRKILGSYPESVLKNTMLTFCNADIFWDKVVEIKEIHGEETVYDFEIENTHNFMANGICIHNSVMLKRISNVAPKARFVSGKGASGAGMTAAVVKDDFLRGWTLEAGALVLANRGLACIDELDKMTKDDTSAMHEALEQQCYHYDTIIQFADGSEKKIGNYVESLLAENRDKIIEGKDCFVLPDNIVTDKIMTTDWNKIFPTKITRVSKHKSPEKLHKITFTHGRSITVTPEHPIYTINEGRVATTRADKLNVGEIIPVPSHMPIKGDTQWFSTQQEEIFNSRVSTHISVPEHNDSYLYRLVGHLVAEGSKEINRKKIIGLNFTNKDPVLLADFATCMKKVFNVDCYEQVRSDDHEPRLMLRAISTELARYVKKEFPELLEPARKKRIPKQLMKGKKTDISQMLMTMFEGDGHVSVNPRTLRIGYGTDSLELAEQVQDLLLRFGIRSSITEHKRSFKVNITGHKNIELFANQIGFFSQTRIQKVVNYLNTKKPTRTVKDVVPMDKKHFVSYLEKNGVKKISKTPISCVKHDLLKKNQSISRRQLQNAVKELESRGCFDNELRRLAFGDIRYEKVKSIEIVESDRPWTYDVTIEPTHTFISQGMVLHNTISISKANIQATLRCETTVLAAANPKFGRFDPYELISKQIDLPPALISRFDLIFPVRDMPDRNKDEKLASFILSMHRKDTKKEPIIDEDTIKRYVAYARQNCHPELSDSAVEEIKNYYVKMRGGDDSEERVKPIPITARQLEALIRLSEASARIHLNNKVTKRDAQRAIELVNYCLQQIGMDPETGKIDLDRVTTGISASARSHITIVKEILMELEKQVGKAIPMDDVIREAEIKGVSKDTAEDVISRLKRSGDVYSPKHGFVSRL